MKEENYTAFESWQDKKFFGFCYPANWTLRENLDLEKKHRQFLIIYPKVVILRNLFFVIRLSWRVKQTVEEAAEDLLQKYSRAFRALELNRTSKEVDGNPAMEIEFSYDMLWPLNVVNPKLTKFHQSSLFIKRGDQLFEISYDSPEEDYNKWIYYFNTLVETFSLSWKLWKPKHHVLPEYA